MATLQTTSTDVWTLPATADVPALHLRRQRTSGTARGAALYVHGATFPSALSVFFRFDGCSWADALNAAGFDAWGFDFAGFGESQRYAAMTQSAEANPPAGRLEATQLQLARVLDEVSRLMRQSSNDRQPLHLIAHSWGTLVALRCAPAFADRLASLTLFGPVARRELPPGAAAPGTPYAAAPERADAPSKVPAWRTLTIWEQYRRFISDVPRNEANVLLDRHIDAWSRAYLATDPAALLREVPSVQVPAGPAADVEALWSGEPLVDASLVRTPTLLVRGQWDSVCDDRDAARLIRELSNTQVRERVLAKGTHLMHLETGRVSLHHAVNEFLLECSR